VRLPTGRPLLQVHQPGYLLMCLFSQALYKTELNLNQLANQQRAFTVVYAACGVVQSKSIYIHYKMIITPLHDRYCPAVITDT
jgi:hypothetical protein